MDRDQAVEKLRTAKAELSAEPGMYATLGALLDADDIVWSRWSFLSECDTPDDVISYFKGKLASTGGHAQDMQQGRRKTCLP